MKMIDYVIAFMLGMIATIMTGYLGYVLGFRAGKDEGYYMGYEDGESNGFNIVDFPKSLDGKFFSTDAAIRQMSKKEE